MKLGLTLVILLPFIINAQPLGLPEVLVKESKSGNGIPSIDITFPDGHQDHLVLERHYMNEIDKMAKRLHCNFIGHLANEIEACVAVTGCPGERMEFTVNSEHAGLNNRFILHQNGQMEKVEGAFREGGFDEPLEIPYQHLGGKMAHQAQFAQSLPATNLMRIKVGYDDSFFADLGSAFAAEAYLESMFTHVQTFFCHPSLGTKIQIERDGGYKYHAGYTWKATKKDEGKYLRSTIRQLTEASSSDAHLFVYMCKDKFFGTIGIAWVGSICRNQKGKKTSINEKLQNVVATAELVAHEIGHNLGMHHDHHVSHGGDGNSCDKQGFMSYGEHEQKWTSCSRKDFLAHYNKIGEGNWCMPGAPSACGESTPNPPPSGCGSPQYKGDEYCDDDNNNLGCDFDGGDCCGDDVNTKYCEECECKEELTTTTTTETAPGRCRYPEYKGDGFCDDGNNNPGCDFDGGDCCGDFVVTTFCAECECLE